ncbi:3'-5' exonuclease [Azospirillum sp. sgz302134]
MSSHDTLLVLDIETMADPQILPADWPAAKFPPPHCHQIVAVSFVEAVIERSYDVERYRITACRSGGELDYDEERILRGFWKRFVKTRPRVVTWNGRGFDLPVMRLRSMVYGITAAAWFQSGDRWNNYAARYQPDWNCDLMEQLADYGAGQRIGLQDISSLLGLPGKAGFGHGSEVADMMARGELEKVRAYCESDVLNTFLAYLRWALLTGRTDPAGHNASVDALADYLAAEREARPHLGEFLDRWRASPRPYAMRVPDPRATATEQQPADPLQDHPPATDALVAG